MPTTTQSQEATAYRLFNGGSRLTSIARLAEFEGITASQIGAAVNRYAARHGLPDPVRRRSVQAANAYRRRAGFTTTAAGLAEAIATAAPSAIIPTRTFGIEIEFRRPTSRRLEPETIAAALRQAGLNCQAENYNHHNRPHWKLIHDASSDRELVSPILSGPEGLAQVRTAMKVLRELGCKVTRSEGMHVHVYVGDTTAVKVAEVFGFYAARQTSVFDRLNAAVRRGRTSYCSGINMTDAARTMEFARRGRVGSVNGRYVTVNLDSFARYGTVEYRQHAGSLNGRKACDWVELMLATTQYVIEHGDQLQTTLEGTLGGLVGAGLLGRRTAARLALKARSYGFECGDLAETPPPAAPPAAPAAIETVTETATETATVWMNCTCIVCDEARARAARGEVTLTTIGA
jgi:hypothetical protein